MSYADLTFFYQMHLTLHLNFRLRHFDPNLFVDTHQNLSLGIESQPSLVPPVNDNITELNYSIFFYAMGGECKNMASHLNYFVILAGEKRGTE